MRIRLSFWIKSKNAKLEVNDTSFYFRDGTPSKMENSYAALINSFERSERTSKSFAAKFENQGKGLYLFAGIKTKQTKNYVLFINEDSSNAVIQVRTKNGIERFNINLSVGGSADNKVLHGIIFTDEAEPVEIELEAVAPVVSTLKERDQDILALMNKLAEAKALIEQQSKQIDELLIVNESLKKDNKRLRKEKSDRISIAETFGEERAESVEKIENELDLMVGITEEDKLAKTEQEIKTRVSINTETVEKEIPKIARSKLTELYINNTDKHNAAWELIDAGKLEINEEE
ncbi:hypothetical protein ACNF2V_15390 [Enterobacter hormaechei]|uniref:hypothetical protein n=1 Tax=Enterobacter cloacae complex TaxID=354276 RepID=UPI000793A011|nr:hypothetical protein [Enterobacter hormaechei]EKX4036385.1 hypothetical protein [Enterobacter cloacae]EMA2158620.1 hypothetical protein [Enterobacter hormaechei]MCM7907772.1 hypothetical protein [Enterobacter hormaechei]MDM9326658.1 hypothetical protein [Enterobacter hormaechei subsp. steigerwaltii]MXS05026.1 hypothetical protein [Enterobacter hormaechei]